MKNKLFFLILAGMIPFFLVAQGVDPAFTAAIQSLEKENVKIPANGMLILINTELSAAQESSILNEHLNNGLAGPRYIIYTTSSFESSAFYKKLQQQHYSMQMVTAKKISDFTKEVTKRTGPSVIYLNGKDLKFVVKID